MKVRRSHVDNSFVEKNQLLRDKGKTKKHDNEDYLEDIPSPGGIIRANKNRYNNYIHLHHNNTIIDIIGKTKGKKKYKIGTNYLLDN